MMRSMQRMGLTIAALALLSASGCIDYHFSAPDRDLVLTTNAEAAMSMARARQTPYVRQRQFGLLDGLIFLSENSLRMSIRSDQKDVALVGGRHFTDYLIGSLTYGILYSTTVRVFTNVR